MGIVTRAWQRCVEQRLSNCEELAERIRRLEARVSAIDTVLDDTVDAMSDVGQQLDRAIDAVHACASSLPPSVPGGAVKGGAHGQA